MKKLTALALVAVMALSMAACNGNNANEGTTAPAETTVPVVETTAPTVETTAPIVETTAPVAADGSALQAMQTVWGAWNFEYKDYFMGGGYTNSVMAAPGAVETTDTESLQYLLYVPEANLAEIQSAASVMHAMNANTFTASTFVVSDAAAFAAIMKDTLMNTQWMCGIPEHLSVYTLGTDTVFVAFGAADNVTGYTTALTTAYADAVSVFDGAMG